jgi:type I restriction enzyme S subunit
MKTAQIKLKNSFTPYPEYRDSGIEWVGKIPKEWNILKFKSLFIASDERVEDDRSVEQILSVSGYRGIEKKNIKSMDGQMPSEDISAYRIVRPGQLVVNTMWLNYTGLGVSDFTGYVSPAYRSYYIASSMHPKFVHSLLRSIPYVQKYSSLLYGIRPNSLQVKPADFEKIEVVVPSFETQKKIAEYLDEKTALIDQIIEKKKKLIALLREKRTAVINNAVTKGLDPSVEPVHSGIEWIGMIPKGWRLRKMKHIARVQASNIDKLTNPNFPSVLLCNYVDVYKNEYIDSALNFMPSTATHEQIKKVGLRKSDVLLTKDSETANDIGIPAVVKENVENLVSGYHLYVARPKEDSMDGSFLFRYLQSRFVRAYFETSANGVTRFGLGSMAVKDTPILVPDLDEQRKIAEYLKEKAELSDTILQREENSIEILKEFKSSLISNVVTGKVKV